MFNCKELTRVGKCIGCGCEGCCIKQDQEEFGDQGYYILTTIDTSVHQDTKDDQFDDEWVDNPE